MLRLTLSTVAVAILLLAADALPLASGAGAAEPRLLDSLGSPDPAPQSSPWGLRVDPGDARLPPAEPPLPDLPPLPTAYLAYVIVVHEPGVRHEPVTAVLFEPTPVDATADGVPDLVLTLSLTGPAAFRLTAERIGTVRPWTVVAAVVGDATHPALPRGERYVIGFESPRGGAAEYLAVDVDLLPGLGVSVEQRADAPPPVLSLVLERRAGADGVGARLTLDPVPPLFRAGLESVGGATALRLGAAASALPARFPVPAPVVGRAAGASGLALAAAEAAVADADAATGVERRTLRYYRDVLAPWAQGRFPSVPAEAYPDLPDSREPAAAAARDAHAAAAEYARDLALYGEAAAAAVLGAPAVTPPTLQGVIWEGPYGAGDAIAAVRIERLPPHLKVTVSAGGGRSRVAYEAAAEVPAVALEGRWGDRFLRVGLDGVPRHLNATWGAGEVTLDASAPIGRLHYGDSNVAGAYFAYPYDHLRVFRLAGYDTLSVSLRGVESVVARLSGDAVGVTVAHAGGPFIALVEEPGYTAGFDVRDLPPRFTADVDPTGRFAFDGSAPVAYLGVLVREGASRTVLASLHGLPAAFALTLTESPLAARWTASGATTRAVVQVEDAGGLGGFTRLDAVLDGVPPSVALAADDAGRFTLDAPGGIGRLLVTASGGATVPVPANGFHYLESGGRRALAVHLPGVALIDADLAGDAARARLVTAGGYDLVGVAERDGERAHVVVTRMPADLSFAYREVPGGARVEVASSARAAALRADVVRGAERYRIEFDNVPRSLALELTASGGATSVTYSASETGDRLEVWTNAGDRRSLWARLTGPVPTSLTLHTSPDAEVGYRFTASQHVTVDVFDDRASGDYLLIENLRVRRLDVAYKGSSTGWIKLDTDNHDVKGRIKTESGSSGFEVHARGHLRAQDYRLDWWNYVPYDWDGTISISDTDVRVKTGGSWYAVAL